MRRPSSTRRTTVSLSGRPRVTSAVPGTMNPRAVIPVLLAALLGCCFADGSGNTTAQIATTQATTTIQVVTTPSTPSTIATTATPSTLPTTGTPSATAMPSMTATTATTATPSMTATTAAPSSENGTTATAAPPTTTTTVPPTTTPPRTTPTPAPIWEVRGADAKVCQKMQFMADVKATYYNADGGLENFTLSVPPTANASGDCSSPVERTFTLAFALEPLDAPWELSFLFGSDTESKTYQLMTLALRLNYEDLVNSTGEGQLKYVFSTPGRPLAGISAPSGKSYSCDSGHVQSEGKEQLSVTLTQLRMQPFANESGGDFGESVTCPYPPMVTPAPPKVMNDTWKYIGIAFIALFCALFLATVAFCYYVKKHKSQSSDTYNLMESY